MAETDPRQVLLDAVLPHVPFDGWSEASFAMAVSDAGLDPALARAVCPRGALDLAMAYHARGDKAMQDKLAQTDLSGLRFRDKVALAVRLRLEASGDREIVRRAATLFALPHLAPEAARMVWETCDLVWTALGDDAQDYNWYTKRASLAGVYSATLLFWLGDQSEGQAATWDFLDRRIEEVMQIEKLKAQVNDNPLLRPLIAGPNWLLSQVRPPRRSRTDGLPGSLQL